MSYKMTGRVTVRVRPVALKISPLPNAMKSPSVLTRMRP